MYERLNRSTENALGYRVTRPLDGDEVRTMAAELEGAISVSGKIRILIDLQAFPYQNLEAFWEDLKFDVRFARDIERLALVGGGKIEKWSTRIFAALSFTKCRCFEEGEVDGAWQWLVEG